MLISQLTTCIRFSWLIAAFRQSPTVRKILGKISGFRHGLGNNNTKNIFTLKCTKFQYKIAIFHFLPYWNSHYKKVLHSFLKQQISKLHLSEFLYHKWNSSLEVTPAMLFCPTVQINKIESYHWKGLYLSTVLGIFLKFKTTKKVTIQLNRYRISITKSTLQIWNHFFYKIVDSIFFLWSICHFIQGGYLYYLLSGLNSKTRNSIQGKIKPMTKRYSCKKWKKEKEYKM